MNLVKPRPVTGRGQPPVQPRKQQEWRSAVGLARLRPHFDRRGSWSARHSADYCRCPSDLTPSGPELLLQQQAATDCLAFAITRVDAVEREEVDFVLVWPPSTRPG